MANMPYELLFEVQTALGSGKHHKRRGKILGQVRVLYDREAGTLTVWFGDPRDEHTCEETGDEVILMKDRDGHVIGFERLSFSVPPQEDLQVAFETI